MKVISVTQMEFFLALRRRGEGGGRAEEKYTKDGDGRMEVGFSKGLDFGLKEEPSSDDDVELYSLNIEERFLKTFGHTMNGASRRKRRLIYGVWREYLE